MAKTALQIIRSLRNPTELDLAVIYWCEPTDEGSVCTEDSHKAAEELVELRQVQKDHELAKAEIEKLRSAGNAMVERLRSLREFQGELESNGDKAPARTVFLEEDDAAIDAWEKATHA